MHGHRAAEVLKNERNLNDLDPDNLLTAKVGLSLCKRNPSLRKEEPGIVREDLFP